MRNAGARVVLVDGALTAFVRGDRDVATFLPQDEPVRSAVILVDVEDLSYESAAEVMGVPIGTVRSRLFRGRRL